MPPPKSEFAFSCIDVIAVFVQVIYEDEADQPLPRWLELLDSDNPPMGNPDILPVDLGTIGSAINWKSF